MHLSLGLLHWGLAVDVGVGLGVRWGAGSAVEMRVRLGQQVGLVIGIGVGFEGCRGREGSASLSDRVER